MSVIRLEQSSMADAEHAVAQIWCILEEHRVASPQVAVVVNAARKGVELSLTFHAAPDATLVVRALAASGLLPIAEPDMATRAPADEELGREDVMTDYRCYLLGFSGSIQSAHDIACEDDEDAIATARSLFEPHAFEVWQRQRRIYPLVEGCGRTHGDGNLDDARRQRLKAEEYRAVADQMTNPAAQASYRRLAQTYDRIADRYEPTPPAQMPNKLQKR